MKLCDKDDYPRLCAWVEKADRIINACRDSDDDELWKDVFNAFFEDNGIADNVRECIGRFEWLCYDTTYKEDTLCYYGELKRVFDTIKVY